MVLVTGLNFTFAAAIMPNLADADDRTFVATMQRFNQNPVFAVTFTATLPLAAVAAWLHRRHGPATAARWTVAALMLYAVMLAITFVINVPLNYEIDEAGDPNIVTGLADVRNDVEGPWIIANIVRTLLSTAAVAAVGWALFQHRRSPADPDEATNPIGSSWPPPPTSPDPSPTP
ncbi:MAG: DUF1772 domain-containing protein [Ilumatobacteraceae bacterium]